MKFPFSVNQDVYEPSFSSDAKIHVVGLGDVGGTLVSGLRLLGGEVFNKIGIFDLDENRMERWEMEGNQIFLPDGRLFPEVFPLKESQLFDCDIFAFCVTAGIPPMGFQGDVRMYQFEKNRIILHHYIEKALESNFQGLFAVVSDPVDQLALSGLRHSQELAGRNPKLRGLSPLQIRGYGLGVMYARALYYAKKAGYGPLFLKEGRAYGPHGEGLVIANSILNYDSAASSILTEKTRTANMRVRDAGYKPYVAPAFSSACLSLIATVNGSWHYSAVYLDGAYLGLYNRTTNHGTEIETPDLDPALLERILEVHEKLKNI